MRRDHKPTYVPFRGRFDIRKSLTVEQLAGIGAAALAYNYVENSINKLFAEAVGLRRETAREVVNRINGIDGKTAAIKASFKCVTNDKEVLSHVNSLFGDNGPFAKSKQYRDALIHSRVLDGENGVGIYDIHRSKDYDILHTADALNILYTTLDLLRSEIVRLSVVYRLLSRIRSIPDDHARRKRYEEHLQAYLAQVREIQRQRLSLDKFPEFPEPRPFPANREFDPVDLG